MDSGRILIAMGSEATVAKLKPILIENSYSVADQARDGHECLRKARALKPDLAILDFNLPLSNGYEVAKVLLEDNICDVIVIATSDQEGLIGSIKSANNFVCMTKPINKQSLLNTIDLIIKNKRRIRELEKEIEDLRASLDTRKEVEKAKGLLMKHLSLTEAEAFKRIQKQSMDRGIPMKEIAKAIILAYDI